MPKTRFCRPCFIVSVQLGSNYSTSWTQFNILAPFFGGGRHV